MFQDDRRSKANVNKWVFSFDLKVSNGMCIVLSSIGSDFHRVEQETAKLRGPMRTVHVRGTTRFPGATDRRHWEP